MPKLTFAAEQDKVSGLEPEGRSDAHLELIHNPTAECNYTTAGADHSLQFRVHDYRQVFYLEPNSPLPCRKDFEPSPDAKHEPRGTGCGSGHPRCAECCSEERP